MCIKALYIGMYKFNSIVDIHKVSKYLMICLIDSRPVAEPCGKVTNGIFDK